MKLTYREVSELVRELRREPLQSYQDLANQFSNQPNQDRVSKDTVQRAVSKRGLYSYVAPRKALLTIKNELKRRRWCKERLHWGLKELSRVIFSDESNFEVINKKNRIRVKRFQNEKFNENFI